MFYFCSAKVSPKKIISKIATINFDLLFDRPQISRFGKPGNRKAPTDDWPAADPSVTVSVEARSARTCLSPERLNIPKNITTFAPVNIQ